MLNATVGAGDMTMQNLADAMGTGVLAVIKGYGATMRDASAALAVFGDNNIRGAAAGTALRMSVQAFAVPAVAGTANLQALGMTTKTLADDMQHGGINQAMTDLHDRLQKAGITGVKVGDWLTTTFGKRAGAGISVLMGQYDRFEQKLGELDKGAGSFADDWTKQQDTAAQKTADFKAALDGLGIQMGNVFLPILTTVVGWVGQGVTWFAAHKQAADALALTIGGVLAVAVGALGVKFAKLLLSPIFKIGGGIADFLGWVGKKVFGYKEVGDAADKDADAEETASERAAAGMQTAADTMQEAADRIVAALTGVAEQAETSAGRTRLALEAGSTAAETAADDFQVAGEEMITRVKENTVDLEAEMAKRKPIWLGAGTDMSAGITEGMEEGEGETVEATTSFAGKIAAAFKKFWRIASPSGLGADYGLNIDQGVAGGITENAGLAVDAAEAMAEKVTAAFEQVSAGALAAGEKLDTQLAAGIIDSADAAVLAGRETAEKVVAAVDEVAATVKPVVVRTVQEGGGGGGGEPEPSTGKSKLGGVGALVGGGVTLGVGVAGLALQSATSGGADPTKDTSFGAAAQDAGNTAGAVASLPLTWDPSTIIAKFKRDIAAFPQQLHDAGKSPGGMFVQGMLDGITGAWVKIEAWNKSVPAKVGGFLAGAGAWLVKQGGDIVSGLETGVETWWNRNVTPWFTSIPRKLATWFNGAEAWLLNAGSNIIRGLVTGIENWWNGTAVPWLKQRQAAVTGFFQDAPTWLLHAGESILQGFLTGLENAWSSVTSFISGIGPWIAAHKGPIDVDAKLLTPHGQAIMTGLIDGLASQMPDLDRQLAAITGQIRGVGGDGATLNVDTLAGLTSTASGEGSTTIVNHYHIAGSVWSERELAQVVQQQALKRGVRNTSSGLNYSPFGGSR